MLCSILHGGRDGSAIYRGGRQRGRAAQVEPIKPKLKPSGTKHLKLNHYELISNSAFKFNLRRYSMEPERFGLRRGLAWELAMRRVRETEREKAR